MLTCWRNCSALSRWRQEARAGVRQTTKGALPLRPFLAIVDECYRLYPNTVGGGAPSEPLCKQLSLAQMIRFLKP
jgi:hypothetical protein